ncbi:uncharacterized protein [Aegilops tauschii subsp. strangulata]|uniref:uncharacterized protein n=1 Tax=Aegilops tauschii subsp. strangulata TaxID=200361 RepID=UPI00098AEC4D|nr:uncharacterized protein LOC109763965 [Aegilops tauschii subsp. strangulata]
MPGTPGWIQACGHSHDHSSPATKTATASTGSSDDLRPSPTMPATCIQLLLPRPSSTSLMVSCCRNRWCQRCWMRHEWFRSRSNVVKVAAALTEDQKKPGDVHHSFS